MIAVGLFVLVLGGVTASWLARALRGLEGDLAALAGHDPSRATRIYSADGALLARVTERNRIYVRIDQVPPALRNATVMAEDRRFWQHRGVDLRSLVRALWRDVRAGRFVEGGSTLTMQLVRNLQLSPEKTLERKAREAVLALQVERLYSKPRILELYLNQVFYGNGAYGVGSAAQAYFGRPVERLSPAQCALLATLPRRPTDFDPIRDPQGALARRNGLLRRMAAEGYLTADQLGRALAEPLGVKGSSANPGRAPYFVDTVVEELVRRYGHEAVYVMGLKVYTTLDTRLQALAEAAVRRGVRRLQRGRVSQGALVSLDPITGEVKALVGGVDYRRSAFNRAVHARRQPGSAFKPFVYAAAMDLSVSPYDWVLDAPLQLVDRWGPDWRPGNHNGRYLGPTTLINAFAQSLNTPAVRLALRAGVPSVAAVAKSCGIQSPLREVPSLALGTSEVTPLELTAAYATFANLGQWMEPQMIRRVEHPDGHVDSWEPRGYSVVDPLVAQKVDFLLRAAVRSGTARTVGAVPRARGKTGTTQRDRDAWFIGYTPELVTGVWMGNDRPVSMRGVWGGTGPGGVWRQFMLAALKRLPRRPELPEYVPVRPTRDLLSPETRLAQASTMPAETDEFGGASLPQAAAWSTEPAEPGTPWAGSAASPAVQVAADPAPRAVRRVVRICMASGLIAGPRCPETRVVRAEDGPDPPVTCPLH